MFISIAFLSCNTEKPKSTSDGIDSIGKTASDAVSTDSISIITLAEFESEHFKSQSLYVKNCKYCHGGEGKGDGIKARVDTTLCPFDLTNEDKPDKYIYYVILDGREKMPNHKKLSSDQINVLLVYIKKFTK